MTDACAQDFSLVGGGTAFDDSGVDTRVACGLPDIPGYTNTPKASNAPLQVQPTPVPPTQINNGALRLLTMTVGVTLPRPAPGSHKSAARRRRTRRWS